MAHVINVGGSPSTSFEIAGRPGEQPRRFVLEHGDVVELADGYTTPALTGTTTTIIETLTNGLVLPVNHPRAKRLYDAWLAKQG
jgi:hypothetical protein